jgi:glyoxylate/hydroxypyruvate reductase A
MALLFSDSSYRCDKIFTALKAAMPGVDLRKFPDVGDRDEIDYAIIWYPTAGSLQHLPKLKAIFAVSAGVDGVVNDATLPDVPLVRSVDPGLTQGMVEYVTYHALRYHRFLHLYEKQQREKIWKHLPQHKPPNKTIGLMGLGEMGCACADTLRHLKFNLRGWSRTKKDLAGVACFHGTEQLPNFLSGVDILVNLLPLTAATRGILNRDAFNALPPGAFLINAGRGAHLNEDDLIAALDSGHLAGACLDAFPVEPLPPSSLLWEHPGITVTPHIASITDFASVSQNILSNIKDFESGKPLAGMVCRVRGY